MHILRALSLMMVTAVSVMATEAPATDAASIRVLLTEAHTQFTALFDSGYVNYKTKFDKDRFAGKIKLITTSTELLDGEDLVASHKAASDAVIGISGLKNAGSIGFVKPQAREMYTKGYVALRDAVVSLYYLKQSQAGQTRTASEQPSASRFIVTEYAGQLEVTTFSPKAGIVAKKFYGEAPVRYARDFVVFRYAGQCVFVSYLDSEDRFVDRKSYCTQILRGLDGILPLSNPVHVDNFNTLYQE